MVREGAPPHPSTQLRSTLFSRSKNIWLIFQHTVDQIAKLRLTPFLFFWPPKGEQGGRDVLFSIVREAVDGWWWTFPTNNRSAVKSALEFGGKPLPQCWPKGFNTFLVFSWERYLFNIGKILTLGKEFGAKKGETQMPLKNLGLIFIFRLFWWHDKSEMAGRVPSLRANTEPFPISRFLDYPPWRFYNCFWCWNPFKK